MEAATARTRRIESIRCPYLCRIYQRRLLYDTTDDKGRGAQIEQVNRSAAPGDLALAWTALPFGSVPAWTGAGLHTGGTAFGVARAGRESAATIKPARLRAMPQPGVAITLRRAWPTSE